MVLNPAFRLFLDPLDFRPSERKRFIFVSNSFAMFSYFCENIGHNIFFKYYFYLI